MTKVTDNVTMLFLLVPCDLRLVTHDMTLELYNITGRRFALTCE